jgi:RHS repeat-associated protein
VGAASLRGDFNRDGVVGSLDLDDYDSASLLGSSSGAVENGPQGWGDVTEPRIGYAGYVRPEWTVEVGYNGNTKGGTTGLTGAFNWWLARNRFYDPLAGRWVNRDPAGYVDGLSMYLYARANPWGLVDPTGLDPQPELKDAYARMNAGAHNLAVGTGWYGGYLGGVVNGIANLPQMARGSTYVEAAKTAVEGENNNARHGGYTPTTTDYAAAIAGELTGANKFAGGCYRYNASEDRTVTAEEGNQMIAEGGNQMVGTAASMAAAGVAAVRGGPGALNPFDRARPVEVPTAETPAVATPKVAPEVATDGVGGEAPANEAGATRPGGGAHEDVKGTKGSGEEGNHCPPDSVYDTPSGQKPAVRMSIPDHRKTASWGPRRDAKAYRAKQEQLIREGRFVEAQQMDVTDIQEKFGSKYDERLYEMWKYSRDKLDDYGRPK